MTLKIDGVPVKFAEPGLNGRMIPIPLEGESCYAVKISGEIGGGFLDGKIGDGLYVHPDDWVLLGEGHLKAAIQSGLEPETLFCLPTKGQPYVVDRRVWMTWL